MTATVSPSAAGTVQFFDGTTSLGAPVTVTNGTATTTPTLAPGPHSLSAVFSPTDTVALSGSTSATVSYTVNPTPTPTPSPTPVPPTPTPTPTPTPVVTPTPTPTPSPIPTPSPNPAATATTTTVSVIQLPLPLGLGGIVIPLAHVAPANATGTVQFKDGSTNLGAPVPTVAGIAVGPTSTLRPGTHQLSAVFTPSNPTTFRTSTSNTVTVRF
ncbi:MAG: Ig-like domain-containing protein [Pseudonocardiaceae bacterium]